MPEQKICSLDQIPANAPFEGQFEGQTIIICRTEKGVQAMEGICPHRGAQLSQGRIEDGVLICPWHDWAFDVNNGQGLSNPMSRLCKYRVEVRDNEVYVSAPVDCSDS